MFRYWRAQPIGNFEAGSRFLCNVIYYFPLILELNAHFITLLGFRTRCVEGESGWCDTWS